VGGGATAGGGGGEGRGPGLGVFVFGRDGFGFVGRDGFGLVWTTGRVDVVRCSGIETVASSVFGCTTWLVAAGELRLVRIRGRTERFGCARTPEWAGAACGLTNSQVGSWL
jgi:hypothetical protein